MSKIDAYCVVLVPGKMWGTSRLSGVGKSKGKNKAGSGKHGKGGYWDTVLNMVEVEKIRRLACEYEGVYTEARGKLEKCNVWAMWERRNWSLY